MNDVTAHSSEKPAQPHAETGWAESRRRSGRGMRTCLPAVLDRTPTAPRGGPAEDTIVRGED
ncbi:hypothetical protein [Streptomyces echinatus]|uniref:Uncharacterized protein n=1 Tax=Streptomyces echinatus TaxID=67293 RepID=A0A7W9PW78_9ACTN|nr:hypothetical protein [Streptomyces echinatus]MBB5928543.1 hypothetical protein [Streptomyces echinatus]